MSLISETGGGKPSPFFFLVRAIFVEVERRGRRWRHASGGDIFNQKKTLGLFVRGLFSFIK
jgi:hypothetical protein